MPVVLFPMAYLREQYIDTIKSTALARMCGFVSTSFFLVAMAVADGFAQFLTWASLLLNSIHRKIQDVKIFPRGTLGTSFQGQNCRTENRSREIGPSSDELTGCPSRMRCE